MSRFLTDELVDHFIQHGYLTLRGCFSAASAAEWIEDGWKRLGYDSNDSSTWAQPRIHQGTTQQVKVRDFAPDAFEAICELCGGEDRINEPMWGNAFIWNLGIEAHLPWQSPQERDKGWHKDGDFFRHFLDSPEQALLPIVIWSDIEPKGGGTFLACDSVPLVARFLADRPEGVSPNEFPFGEMKAQCREFVEATGQIGDVMLIHPFLLHAASQNVRGTARIITNPPVHFKEPMNFARDDGNYSPVERAILRALNVERLEFQPTAPRERIVPLRVLAEQKRREAEREAEAAKLAAAP